MKFILCQPAIKRFEWELEVCLTNLKSKGIDDIILLFSRYDDSIPLYLSKKYGVEVHVYEDLREDKEYIPSIKPYLWWQFLKENPSAGNETYFYMDSDVIFREVPGFSKTPANEEHWYGSNCNGYLNYDYILQCKNGETILQEMSSIVGVSMNRIKSINENSIGAQYVIASPTAEYWQKVYEDSNKLWQYFKTLDTTLQIWTAEMWSTLWNMLYFGIYPRASEELEFCWATDDMHRWYETKIMHNAGVCDDMERLFFKGKYVETSPFDDELSYVDEKKVSKKYVEAIEAVK